MASTTCQSPAFQCNNTPSISAAIAAANPPQGQESVPKPGIGVI